MNARVAAIRESSARQRLHDTAKMFANALSSAAELAGALVAAIDDVENEVVEARVADRTKPLKVRDIAADLNAATSTVYLMIDRGAIPGVERVRTSSDKPGRMIRVDRARYEAWRQGGGTLQRSRSQAT
jgi:hypothetical protein